MSQSSDLCSGQLLWRYAVSSVLLSFRVLLLESTNFLGWRFGSVASVLPLPPDRVVHDPALDRVWGEVAGSGQQGGRHRYVEILCHMCGYCLYVVDPLPHVWMQIKCVVTKLAILHCKKDRRAFLQALFSDRLLVQVFKQRTHVFAEGSHMFRKACVVCGCLSARRLMLEGDTDGEGWAGHYRGQGRL